MVSGYKISAEIAHGGMAVVYRAVRLADGADVALKIFDVPDGAHRDMLERKFVQEAKLLATLAHPNLVHVLDSGWTDDGRPWLAMELVEGDFGVNPSLAVRMASSKPFWSEEVERIYAQLRAALAYCHEHGIVHGDVKVENVLIDRNGTVKLADFGIARVLQPEMRRVIGFSTMTLEGNLGTPYARAPECRNGEKATAATDIYSLGVLLFKLVTGIWYEGSIRLLDQARKIAPEWHPLLARMLAANPAARFQTAGGLPEDPRAEGRKRLRWRRCLLGTELFVGGAAVATLIACLLWPDPPPRRLTDSEWGRYFFGTNEFDYVEEATLVRTNLVLRKPVMYGTLHLPDTNGCVEILSPSGYEGFLVVARKIEGDLFSQTHVTRVGKLRVRASDYYIRVGYHPFPRSSPKERPGRAPIP